VVGVLEKALGHDAVTARCGIAAKGLILLIKLMRSAAQANARPVAVMRLVAPAAAAASAAMVRLAMISTPSTSHVVSVTVVRPHQSVHCYPLTL
jgi:hypothetical protein